MTTAFWDLPTTHHCRSRYRGAGPPLFWAQPLTPSGGMHMIVFALAGVLFLIGGWGAYAGWNRRWLSRPGIYAGYRGPDSCSSAQGWC